jgi:hypothetical protein
MGGFLYFGDGPFLFLQSSSFSDINATEGGGVIHINTDGKMFIFDSSFSSCQAKTGLCALLNF